MKLIFKQKILSWLDSYEVYDETENIVYTVKSELAWGKKLHVYGANGGYLGTVREKLQFFSRPKFEIYIGHDYAGIISKRITFFKPELDIEYLGWYVEGDFTEWDYTVYSADGNTIATISKELWKFSDTYTIDVANPDFALNVLMLVIAIDAEKDRRDSNNSINISINN